MWCPGPQRTEGASVSGQAWFEAPDVSRVSCNRWSVCMLMALSCFWGAEHALICCLALAKEGSQESDTHRCGELVILKV